MDEATVYHVGLNTSLLINSHIAIMTINKSKDQKTSFKETYMNLLLIVTCLSCYNKSTVKARNLKLLDLNFNLIYRSRFKVQVNNSSFIAGQSHSLCFLGLGEPEVSCNAQGLYTAVFVFLP